MTQDEVRDLIDKYIIKNSMGAITAVIMRPILEEILNQPNALIGNLEYLDTLEKATIVDAINSIVNGQIVEINAKILELIDKDVEQDQRLDLVEQHDRDQDGRLDSIENHDASQDVRLDGIELKNEDQDEQITLINLKDNAQDIQISDLQNKDSEQDTRLTDIEGVNSNQDIEIQSLKNKDISQDVKIQNLKDKDVLQDAEITDLDNRVDTLENKVATVYIPKGSVTDITALFALTNQGIGWVYNLEDTGMNYVWLGGNQGDQGNGWDSLGGWVDFSEYYTRLEVDAKLDAIDLQKVTDIGNTTTNDIHIVNGSSGNQLSLITRRSEAVLKYVDTDVLLDETNVKVNKELVGLDATQPKGLTTLQQVSNLIARGGGDVEVGFGLSKNADGLIMLGNINNDLGFEINHVDTSNKIFLIGAIENEDIYGFMYQDGYSVVNSLYSTILKSEKLEITCSSTVDILSPNISIYGAVGVKTIEITKDNIKSNVPITGTDGVSKDDLTTLRQVEGLIKAKDYILSPDGSKWGIDDTGNTYKLP